MTKQIGKRDCDSSSVAMKRGSSKPSYAGNLANGLNRRAFLKVTSAASFSAFIAACSTENTADLNEKNESETLANKSAKSRSQPQRYFDEHQKSILEAVQQHLFPEDGDGPSAKSINAYLYLEFAMTDQKNIDDGDPEFITKGIGWLEDLSSQSLGEEFLKLPSNKQVSLLEKIATSSAGENWLSLLMYYLTEALLLDPIYGGNKEQAGWTWLEHQAGFPRPVVGKTYRDFE